MEYRDVHGILPKSHMWKFPGRGSVKYEKIHNEDYFKWDYKIPYRDSIYFIRRFFPDMPTKTVAYHNLPISKEDIDEFSKTHMNWRGNILLIIHLLIQRTTTISQKFINFLTKTHSNESISTTQNK